MAFFRLPIISLVSTILLAIPSTLLAQQSEGQIGSDDDVLTVSEINTESYLETVSKAENTANRPFRPTASDLLIQQAEEKLHAGRDAYRQKDSDRARSAFNEAIELMLRASDNPSDRLLYESRMEEMVDSIHRLDMAGLGAAVPPSDSPQFEKAPLEELLQMTFPLDPKIKNKVQGELSATSVPVPGTLTLRACAPVPAIVVTVRACRSSRRSR